MADHGTSDLQERQVNVRSTFVANPQAAELVQPTDRPLPALNMHPPFARQFGIQAIPVCAHDHSQEPRAEVLRSGGIADTACRAGERFLTGVLRVGFVAS